MQLLLDCTLTSLENEKKITRKRLLEKKLEGFNQKMWEEHWKNKKWQSKVTEEGDRKIHLRK